MNQYLEALLFGIASVAVFLVAWIVLLAYSPDDGVKGLVGGAVVGLSSLIETAGVAVLGFVAGTRRSSGGLLAIIAFHLAAIIAVWALGS